MQTNFRRSRANAGYVELLGLTENVHQLKTANNEFNAVYMGRLGEKLVRDFTENMKSIRPKVDTAFRSLSSAINVLYQFNFMITRSDATETELGGLIDGVNTLIVSWTKPFLCVERILRQMLIRMIWFLWGQNN